MFNEQTELGVQAAINTERQYQKKKWGPDPETDSTHTVGDFILYMEDYHEEGQAQVISGQKDAAIETLRKVAALGVACLEQHLDIAFNDRRRVIYDHLIEIQKVAWLPQVMNSTDMGLIISYQSLHSLIRNARHLQSRERGDRESIRAIKLATRFAMNIMLAYGAPLRA